MKTDEIREYIVNQVLNARELCGDERQAAIDAAADLGKRITTKGLSVVMSEVNKQWADYQCQAGVTNPISPDERASINKVFNEDIRVIDL